MHRKKWTLQNICNEVVRLDPKMAMQPDSETFMAAVILLAMTRVGVDVPDLVKFTGYPRAFIRAVVQRCRQNKIVHRGALRVKWWDKGTGHIEFWLDVGAALGEMESAA
jgi:hypothetical protein